MRVWQLGTLARDSDLDSCTTMGGLASLPGQAPEGGEIEIWGDGLQTRSFLYVDECLEGVRRLFEVDFTGPVSIGSEEMVSINQLAELVMDIAGEKLSILHIKGPLGVRGRNSDNHLIAEKLGWKPSGPLRGGLKVLSLT